MTRKEIFIDSYLSFISKDGFEYKKSTNYFQKKIDQDIYIISFTSSPFYFDLEPSYFAFLFDVEHIKKKAWGKDYSKFETFGCEKISLVNYDVDKSLLETYTEELALNSAKLEGEFYYSNVKPYFEKHSNIETLNEILNNNIGSNLKIAHNKIHSSFLAIIVAYLCRNPNINQFIEYHRGIINKVLTHKHIWEAKYELLVNYISENPL